MSRPDRFLPPGKTWYAVYRTLDGSQGRSGRCKISPPTGIRSPDRSARSQSLYRLSYPARVHIVRNKTEQRKGLRAGMILLLILFPHSRVIRDFICYGLSPLKFRRSTSLYSTEGLQTFYPATLLFK